MIQAGTKIEILPEFQDAGDADYDWFAVSDEENGRITISPVIPGLRINPQQVVRVEWIKVA